MPYSTPSDVEFYGSFSEATTTYGYEYVNALAKAITAADVLLDEYLQQPRGFFEGGGIELDRELHDGLELGHANQWVRFFGSRRDPKLRLKYTPVLSVTLLEEETSAGSWTSRTEGRGNDYLVLQDGIRFLRNVPTYDYQNIRVSYRAGYTHTPPVIQECSARLAASLLQLIEDASNRTTSDAVSTVSMSLSPMRLLSGRAFTKELQELVKPYRRKIPVRSTST